MRSLRVQAAVLVLVLFAPAYATVRMLLATARTAASLRGHSIEERRSIVLGSWYATVQEVRRRVPTGGSVDMVMLTPAARDVAVFAGAALSPRDVRFFSGWAQWRARQRAVFMHDSRSANAAPGPSPGAASLVIVADPRADPPLRIVSPP